MDVKQNEFSSFFPILEQMSFLNHAGVAPISGPAAMALRRYADQAETSAYIGAGWYQRLAQIKASAARLLNARGSHEIAFVPNTTSGLAMVANGLQWNCGDQVVISNIEYPANRYPWENLTRRGVELIEVAQHPDGRIDVEDLCEAVTNRTRVVSISHVQYTTGYRIDLAPISAMVHQAGGYLCVDAIQSVGVLPVDVQGSGIDFLSADGHKWMLSPEGCGLFYCHEDLCPLLHPNVVGWMNMVEADRYGDYRFELLPDARRFEPASYNLPGILALGASIDLLLETGIEQVWSSVESLTGRLCEGLSAKGYCINSPRARSGERSGIVTFTAPSSHQPHERIIGQLQKQQIVIVVREGYLRASPHFYNTPEQIDRLIDALP